MNPKVGKSDSRNVDQNIFEKDKKFDLGGLLSKNQISLPERWRSGPDTPGVGFLLIELGCELGCKCVRNMWNFSVNAITSLKVALYEKFKTNNEQNERVGPMAKQPVVEQRNVQKEIIEQSDEQEEIIGQSDEQDETVKQSGEQSGIGGQSGEQFEILEKRDEQGEIGDQSGEQDGIGNQSGEQSEIVEQTDEQEKTVEQSSEQIEVVEHGSEQWKQQLNEIIDQLIIIHTNLVSNDERFSPQNIKFLSNRSVLFDLKDIEIKSVLDRYKGFKFNREDRNAKLEEIFHETLPLEEKQKREAAVWDLDTFLHHDLGRDDREDMYKDDYEEERKAAELDKNLDVFKKEQATAEAEAIEGFDPAAWSFESEEDKKPPTEDTKDTKI